MLGINWFRIGAVIALFLGSVYVLLPTILQDDLESRLAAQASGIQTPTAQRVDLDMHFSTEGDAASAATSLKARLDAGGVPVERVQVDEAGNLEVLLGVGADKASRLAMIIRMGRSLYIPAGARHLEESCRRICRCRRGSGSARLSHAGLGFWLVPTDAVCDSTGRSTAVAPGTRSRSATFSTSS